jgi:hypothetical protein
MEIVELPDGRAASCEVTGSGRLALMFAAVPDSPPPT